MHICPRAPWSPSLAARTLPTSPPSGARWTASRSSTTIWSCYTAADLVRRRSPQAGPRRTAFTRSCANPNWGRDGKAAPFRRNDVLLNFLPKGLLAFPWFWHHQQSESTRHARSESPSFSPLRNGTLQGRSSAITLGARTGPFFMPCFLKTKSMPGRFAPPPTARAYARSRLARSSNDRIAASSARRFAPSPYAGADATRHRPTIPNCNFNNLHP